MSTLIPAQTQQYLLGKVFVSGIGFMDPKYIRVVGFTPKRVLVEPVPARYISNGAPYTGQFMPDPDWLQEHPVTGAARRGYEKALWKSDGDNDLCLQYGGSRVETDFYYEVRPDKLPHREYMPD